MSEEKKEIKNETHSMQRIRNQEQSVRLSSPTRHTLLLRLLHVAHDAAVARVPGRGGVLQHERVDVCEDGVRGQVLHFNGQLLDHWQQLGEVIDNQSSDERKA